MTNIPKERNAKVFFIMDILGVVYRIEAYTRESALKQAKLKTKYRIVSVNELSK